MTNQTERSGQDFRDIAGWSSVIFENTSQTLFPGKEFSTADDEFLLDSGLRPVELPVGSDPLTPEQIDAAYRETVAAGVIDHHFIDGKTIGRIRLADRKCAAKMVYDYREEVFEMIKAGRVRNNTHASSDMDALVSSYLVQSMVQGRGDSIDDRLPDIAKDLVELTNLVDYGRYRALDFKTFKDSLVGIIGALRNVSAKNINREFVQAAAGAKDTAEPLTDAKGWRTAAGEKVFKELSNKYDVILGRLAFEVLNITNTERISDKSMSLTSCGDRVLVKASPELRAVLDEGLEISRQQFEDFDKEWKKVETWPITVKTKTSDRKQVLISVIFEPVMAPTGILNLAYNRVPENLVAVFAGASRSAGDAYDIGISPELGEEIDLSEICVALNKAEAAVREKTIAENRSLEEIQATPEAKRTPDEKKIIVWLTGNERFGQSGVLIPSEASIEEKRELQVITRDPTVLVAGGSLIASSFTSVLSREEFVECLKSLK